MKNTDDSIAKAASKSMMAIHSPIVPPTSRTEKMP